MRSASMERKRAAYAALGRACPMDRRGPLFEDLIAAAYGVNVGPGDTVLDLGAHKGLHVKGLAEAVGPSGRVHAVEPLPIAIPMLRKAVRDGGIEDRVSIHETALGDRQRLADFYVLDGALGMSALVERVSDTLRDKVKVSKIEVSVSTLDDLFRNLTRLSFVKADVQGAEYHVFAGGTELIQRTRPTLAFENGRGRSAAAYDYSMDDFFGLFKSLNYDLFDVLGFEFTTKDWSVGGAPWYYFAIPSEARALHGSTQAAIDDCLDRNGLGEIVA